LFISDSPKYCVPIDSVLHVLAGRQALCATFRHDVPASAAWRTITLLDSLPVAICQVLALLE